MGSRRAILPPLSPAKDIGDYAIFSGATSRWMWRIYVQRLTPAGRWFALASFMFISYAGASLQLQGYMPAMYVTAIWAVAAVAMLLSRPRVRLSAEMSERICAGETLPVDLTIEQLDRIRGGDLVVVAHRLPVEIDAVEDQGIGVPDLKEGQRTNVRMHLLCKRRGKFTLRGFRVETGFPFGIVRARRMFPENRPLLVYPRFHPLARLELPAGRRYQPGGVALASKLGESFEYLGNREYREGDNVRDIDWRATARVGRPIVREWIEEYMMRVAVVLDTHVPKDLMRKEKDARRDGFERAISVAAAVGDYMARQDYLVDVFAAGPNLFHLTAGRSLAYRDQILDILAAVDESETEPFEVIEPQIAELLSRISTVICVLLDWDRPRREFVQRLMTQQTAVKVIIARDSQCTIDPAAEADTLGPVPIVSKALFDAGVEEL